MKKTVWGLLLLVVLMNFIFSSVCYAETDSMTGGLDAFIGDGTEEKAATPSEDIGASILEDGKVQSQQSGGSPIITTVTMAGKSMLGAVLGYLALLIDAIPLQLQVIFSSMATTSVTNSNGDTSTDFWVTIEKIVFNEVALFNIDYFDNKDNYTVGTGENELTIEKAQANTSIRKSVSKTFYICRIIAMVISLLVLIYIGIRMVLSTVASDKAKYKKMIFSWVESVAIMFLLVYIMSLVTLFGKSITNVFYDIKCTLLAEDESFETTIVNQIFYAIFDAGGIRLAMYSFMYWVLIFSQFKFLYLYMKRTLMVGFLIIISPLITITYSIDKAGDGKAQAFTLWKNEFLINVLIQPLHALIYMVFMFSASAIAKYAPILALAFLLALGRVERMVKVIFNMRNSVSLRGVDKFLKKK